MRFCPFEKFDELSANIPPIWKKAVRSLPVWLIVIAGCSVILFVRSGPFNGDYHLEQGDAPDGAPEITLVSAKDGHTGRFPDIARLRDGRLMAVFYWNNTHAPYDCADSVGTICAVIGSPDGLSWEADRRVLVDEDFLSGYGLGVWMDAEGRFYYDKAEAQTANARFCVDVRDPNLCAMRDGTLALTYFTRVPVTAKIGGHRLYNEGRDYTTGRSYLLTSADDGLTWSAPVEIPCSYLDLSCAKRGNICQYSDGSCLIPLYGKSSQCVKLNRRFQKIYPDTTACVLAKRNDDGTWSFLEEYNSRSLAFGLIRSPGVFRAKNNEVSLIADERDCTFALCRPSGDILRSEDKGQSWKLIGENAKSPQVSVQQPGFCAIPNSDDVFVTWSETISPGNRAVFARVYHMKSAWNPLRKVMIYQNMDGGDMADPSSVYVGNQTMLTVFYDVSAGCIGGVFTELLPGKSA